MNTFKLFILFLTLILCINMGLTGCMAETHYDGRDIIIPNAPPASFSEGMQTLIEDEIEKAGIPGILIEVVTPEWTWKSAAGSSSPLTAEPANPDMRFLIASVTKSVTSIAIQKLAEEGKLDLADPIEKWLPAELMDRIPNGKEMTIRQLLDHTSGIADYDEQSINLEELHNPDVPVPYQVSLEQGLSASPLFSPGTNYTYSNVNYILLTLIIDAASGIPYEDYVTRNIIIPAGLNETFIQHTNHIPGPHIRATMPDENGTINDFTDLYILFDRGAGDIVSTVSDMNQLHQALRQGTLIKKETLADMEKPTPQSGKSGYGLGYTTSLVSPPDITVQGHTGGYPGSFSFWYYLPEKDAYLTYDLNSIGTAPDTMKTIRSSILHYLKDTIPEKK